MKVIHNPFVKYVKFKKWWANCLSKRPNKLIDFNTRNSMTLNKRVILEKPKVDDLCSFLTDEGLDILFHNTEKGWICKVNKSTPQFNIVKYAETPSRVIKLAALDYLKEDVYNDV